MVSIIILTHNAPEYVKLVLDTLKLTNSTIDYEVIVWDNASEKETRGILLDSYNEGKIDKLYMGKKNLFFAKGNNLAAKLVSPESKYLLFLNSDIEIRSAEWLEKILSIHERGITSFGLGMSPKGRVLPDGYCFLIDRDLYERYPMNEEYEWWYGLSYTIAPVLKKGYSVKVVSNHNKFVYHFGGKSGDAWKSAKGMQEDQDLFDKIYKGCNKDVAVIHDLDKGVGNEYPDIGILRGICEDSWCTPRITFDISVGEKGVLSLKGYCPFDKGKKKKLFFCVNGKKTDFEFSDENFEISITKGVRKNALNRVSIECDFGYKVESEDIRELCFVIKEIIA